MKIIMKNIIVVFIFSFFVLGCESILDEEPQSIIDPERFYNTETDGIAAIAGIYSHIMNGDAFGINLDIYFDVNHDLLTPTRALGAGQEFYAYKWDENTPRIRAIWQRMYQAVNDANLLIKSMETASINEAAKRDIIAEGIFLRAFIYYYLTAMYGDVPFITEPTVGDNLESNASASRTNATQIRQQLVQQLSDIENDLPESRPVYKQRATRWAAKALKIKLYLWLEDYEGAISTAIDIRDNSEHELLLNYADIFNASNEFNDEIIFTLDYLFDEFPTNRHSRYTPRGQDDGLPAGKVPSFFDGFGFFSLYKSFANSFASNDVRRAMNVFDQLEDGTPLRYAYLPKQWRVNDARGNSGLNFKMFRLADVLLNLAEAENELNGPTTQAYEAINAVRVRAELDPLLGLSKEELREAIKQERSWELVGEGTHRKMDLLRWNELEEALKDRLVAEQNDPTAPANLVNVIQETVDGFESHEVLLPIPNDEILLNNNLSQNQGYVD